MEKLMKPAEYAKELGISRQAVYAKIKRGILTAKDVEGKLYIVVDETASEEKSEAANKQTTTAKRSSPAKKNPSVRNDGAEKDYESLLAAKDETIAVLKSTVKDLKKSHKQISTTLRGEIELLKEAFHEMRTLYVQQLEHRMPKPEAIEIVSEAVTETEWIGVKKLIKRLGIDKEKRKEKFLKQIKRAWKEGDERVMRTAEGKFRVDADADYGDMLL